MTGTHEHDAAIEAALPDAMRLAVVVHDRDQAGVHEVLRPLAEAGDWAGVMALCVALGALVPVDTPAADLLAWSFGPHVTAEQYAEVVHLSPSGMKKCSSCRETWALREFHRDVTKPDGRKPRCRHCIAEGRTAAAARGEGAA